MAERVEDSIWYRLIFLGLEFFGRYYSSYRGFVVDNDDPKKLGRVKIIMPSIYPNDQEGRWAYPKNNWGGKDYGMNLLPQKGDMVWLEFEMGDLEYPLWSHHSWGEDERPDEFTSPNVYGIKTPKGNKAIIDDNDDCLISLRLKTDTDYLLIEKDKLTLDSMKIILGENENYKAVLGEKAKEKFEGCLDSIKDLIESYQTHTHPSMGSPMTPDVSIPILLNDIELLKQTLNEILSNKVYLDE